MADLIENTMAIDDVKSRLGTDKDRLFPLNDGTIYRFLKAHKYSINKVIKLLKQAEEWRQQEEIKKIEYWIPSSHIIDSFDVYELKSTDNEGRPVFYAPLGTWSSAYDFYRKGQGDDCLRYCVKAFLYQIYEKLLKTKHQQFSCIVDLTGSSYAKALKEIQNFKGISDILRIFREYEAYFPETLYKAYVINTPSFFYWGYNLVRPLMMQRTVDKIRIFDLGDKSWADVLSQELPVAAVPKEIGGSGEMMSIL